MTFDDKIETDLGPNTRPGEIDPYVPLDMTGHLKHMHKKVTEVNFVHKGVYRNVWTSVILAAHYS